MYMKHVLFRCLTVQSAETMTVRAQRLGSDDLGGQPFPSVVVGLFTESLADVTRSNKILPEADIPGGSFPGKVIGIGVD